MIGDSHGFVDKVEIVLPQLQRYLAYPYLIFISHESFTSDVMEHLGADPNRLNKNKAGEQCFINFNQVKHLRFISKVVMYFYIPKFID